jgi:hypothetical protein
LIASPRDKVGFIVDKIRAAGKVAGTLVTAAELPLEKGGNSSTSTPTPSCASDWTVSRSRSGGEPCALRQHGMVAWHLNCSN